MRQLGINHPDHDLLADLADCLAVLLSAARDQQRRAGAMDAIIAATAIVHALVVWTQDDDFAVLAEIAPDLLVARS